MGASDPKGQKLPPGHVRHEAGPAYRPAGQSEALKGGDAGGEGEGVALVVGDSEGVGLADGAAGSAEGAKDAEETRLGEKSAGEGTSDAAAEGWGEGAREPFIGGAWLADDAVKEGMYEALGEGAKVGAGEGAST